MGGEHYSANLYAALISGSSPRGRGTWHAGVHDRCLTRVIPAWAGNILLLVGQWCLVAGHPRVGGEHLIPCGPSSPSFGSSPRGRGTLGQEKTGNALIRVIPAWAGNILCYPCTACKDAGHPRVGGEHSSTVKPNALITGSSPRGRGTSAEFVFDLARARVIPAWAGNINRQQRHYRRQPGHPRVGGEHRSSIRSARWSCGSSPRGRGTCPRWASGHGTRRVIPAWAGNIRAYAPGCSPAAGHPRVGGEHCPKFPWIARPVGSSPRGRGTFRRLQGGLWHPRVIPAWAGNIRLCLRGSRICPGHPRVGGEH